MFKQVKTIYFDFDGTLHNTLLIYGPALRHGYQLLVDAGFAKAKAITDEEAKNWLGYNALETWQSLVPGLAKDVLNMAQKTVGQKLDQLLNEGKGGLYEGSDMVLMELKRRGYVLNFLSNCTNDYMQTVKNIYHLDQYMEGFYCCEDFQYQTKSAIIRLIADRHPQKQMIVGDRLHDMEAGFENGIDTVFCSYGFGEIKEGKDATRVIDSLPELLKMMP